MKNIKLSLSTLRPFSLVDADALSQIGNNVKIWRNVRDGFPHPYEKEHAEFFIIEIAGKTHNHVFCIEVEGQVAGAIGLHGSDIPNYQHSVEMGYWLGENFWGRGIISEVIPRVIQYAFDELKLTRINAACFEHNPVSKHILQKSGFTLEGVRTKGAMKEGKVIDEYQFGIWK